MHPCNGLRCAIDWSWGSGTRGRQSISTPCPASRFNLLDREGKQIDLQAPLRTPLHVHFGALRRLVQRTRLTVPGQERRSAMATGKDEAMLKRPT